MTSINTNIAAQTALRTLQSTNAQLDQTQGRISTGLKIAEAKDNAAYWSISTTLRSDNKALGTVKDALALGAATVDTAYQGLNETLAVLDEITAKLTAATNGNVDKAAVGREIAELQEQLKGIAGASTFSGENWLSVGVNNERDKSIVSGFTRDRDGTITLANIQVDTSRFILVDNAPGQDGLLEGSGGATSVENDGTAFAGLFVDEGTTIVWGAAEERTLGARDVVSFSIETAAGVTRVEIDQRLINEELNVTDGRIRNLAEFEDVLNAAMVEAGLRGVSTSQTGGSPATTITLTGGSVEGAGVAASRAGVLGITGLADMSVEDIRLALNTVAAASATVKDSATTLGAVAKRIDLQQSFVSNLMDTIDAGVSGLVDADMNEESTRLQALQVKQQLGVQALSIANQSAQNVLRLFQ